MKSVNPATAEAIRDYPELSLSDVDNRLVVARDAFALWSRLPLSERCVHLLRMADRLRSEKGALARLMVLEMGKPITQAEAEIEKCAWVCEHYADAAPGYLAEEVVATEAAYSAVRYEPLGPVLAVMPWNFPFWQFFRCAAPALAAGNVILLKHADSVPGCSLAIEELFLDTGFSTGIVSSLLVGHDVVERIIAHPAIAGVALTGSVRAGRAVGAAAGRAIKKSVLELGGSDAFVVLADADLGRAVEVGVKARIINSGQSCIAAKRFIVEAPIAERFEELFTERMRALRVGDPMDPSTDVGPLARADLREALHEQVQKAVEERARVLTGGDRLERAGFFYQPTVVSGVTPGMRLFEEETFGPVAAMVRADDVHHAIGLSKHPAFGLGASIWTRDPDRGRELASEIQAGSVFVNGMVASDPRLPFGGIKESGYGRELGAHGIREFTNVKTVVVA